MGAFKRNIFAAIKVVSWIQEVTVSSTSSQESTAQKSLEKEELTPNSQSRMDKTQQNVLGNKPFYSEARRK